MLFFSAEISEFNKRFPNLFGLEDKEDDEEDEGRDSEEEHDGSQGEDEAAEGFGAKWNFIILVDEVSETTRIPWDQVFLMEIGEFLTIVCYARDKAEHQKKQYEEYRRKH